MSYHHFKDENGNEYGSFEVFYKTEKEIRDEWDSVWINSTAGRLTGWYWWPCFPGCMPDGDPQGPYESEEEATQAAQMEV